MGTECGWGLGTGRCRYGMGVRTEAVMGMAHMVRGESDGDREKMLFSCSSVNLTVKYSHTSENNYLL